MKKVLKKDLQWLMLGSSGPLESQEGPSALLSPLNYGLHYRFWAGSDSIMCSLGDGMSSKCFV